MDKVWLKIFRYLFVGLGEIALCLLLIAIAPIFINSSLAWIGLLIWCFVILLLSVSGYYVLVKYLTARQSRTLFVTKFPEYSDLTIYHFLDFSYRYVAQTIENWEAIKDDPDFETLNISPFDLLQQRKQK